MEGTDFGISYSFEVTYFIVLHTYYETLKPNMENNFVSSKFDNQVSPGSTLRAMSEPLQCQKTI